MILGFNGQYRFLSNFYPSIVEFEGRFYPTVEHAYQAAKTEEDTVRKYIASLETAVEAKKFGRMMMLRSDWEDVKYPIMKALIRKKFPDRNRDEQRSFDLMNTGDEYLEETNYWHDQIWGNCICGRHVKVAGENLLGKLLMERRDELQRAERAGSGQAVEITGQQQRPDGA